MTEIKDYFALLRRLKNDLSEGLDFIQSVIAYGSVCRLELVEGKSDIDLLVLLRSDVLSEKAAAYLADVIERLFREFEIKIHLRIRNARDLKERTSGLIDCGFTSSVNKLRDSILLSGEALDDDYLAFIQSATVHGIEENLRQRFSDLRYRVRALVSAVADSSIVRPSSGIIKYRTGCMICQLAELVCYSRGVLFINSEDALQKAREIASDDLFSEAMALKRDEMDLYLFETVSRIDEIIFGSLRKIDIPSLGMLKLVRLTDSSPDGTVDGTVTRWRQLRTDLVIPPDLPLIVKSSHVEGGELVITRYAV